MRYDAAIIGAGTNGLAAAAALAGAGLKTIVIERAGACRRPRRDARIPSGLFASPFCDEMAPIPAEIFRALDLARHGAIFVPAPSSLALWPDRRHEVLNWAPEANPGSAASPKREARADEIRARAFADGSQRAPEWLAQASGPAPWPGADWSAFSLADLLDDAFIGSRRCQSACDGGRALRALRRSVRGGERAPSAGAPAVRRRDGRDGDARGGASAGRGDAAGAEISLGLEAADIRLDGARATGVRLADGTAIEARAVISTLDLRRTFFSLFAWKDLPGEAVERVSRYRIAGGRRGCCSRSMRRRRWTRISRKVRSISRPTLDAFAAAPMPRGECGSCRSSRR